MALYCAATRSMAFRATKPASPIQCGAHKLRSLRLIFSQIETRIAGGGEQLRSARRPYSTGILWIILSTAWL
jgi:hypothetical protein